ncbi:methyl-accepting chemotaxis protein [Evansella sp. LMS18]|uniref:methyl-accepting chemotaxis protein n=1 Tax=Evansella sp. LMS18 TaxID=2924033 RepID=UPI0020D01933|nr:methyl-accepting chemotaxis protein [Evansella sp. LMS18]UTR12273.1 methyl-accepting chemotaxis protein [Evansella sp. LMS18]
MRTIRGKLTVFACGLVILTMLLASVVIIIQLSDTVERSVDGSAESSVNEVNRYIHSYFDKFQNTVELMAEDERTERYLLNDNQNLSETEFMWSDISQAYENFMELEEDVQLMYIGTSSGELVSAPVIDLPEDFDPRTRPWYENAAGNEGRIIWTDPYLDVNTGELTITGAKAVYADGRLAGVMGMDILLNDLTETLSGIELGYGGELVLLNSEGSIIVHPDDEMLGSEAGEGYINDIFQSGSAAGSVADRETDQTIYYSSVEGLNWKLLTVYKNSELYSQLTEIRNIILIVTAAAILLAAAASYIAANRIARPVRMLNGQLKRMAAGDFTEQAEIKGKDEIAQLTASVNDTSNQLKGLIASIQSSVNESRRMSEDLSAVSEETLAASDGIAGAVNEVAAGAVRQTEEIEETSNQMRGLSETVSEAGRKTNELNILSGEVKQVSETGIEKMSLLDQRTKETHNVFNQVNNAINQLTSKVDEINVVINTISEFADQTNLLALNASIEAARAGEHGLGFAVVAAEVRKLAEQSMEAAGKIRKTISDVQNETERVAGSMQGAYTLSGEQEEAVKDTQNSFVSIVEHIQKMSDSIADITGDLKKVNEQKEQMMDFMENISTVAEESAAAIEEVSASATEQVTALNLVGKSAESLNELSSELEERANRFKV